MTIALQNAKGPDEAATSVQAKVQSSTSLQDQKMNEQRHNTGVGILPALSRRGFLGAVAVTMIPVGAATAIAAVPVPLTPAERIAAAVREIEAAMAERFPGFTISATVEDKRPQVGRAGSFVEGEISRSIVMIYASENRYGPEEARWFVNYQGDAGVLS
jgi:hypothetical protein